MLRRLAGVLAAAALVMGSPPACAADRRSRGSRDLEAVLAAKVARPFWSGAAASGFRLLVVQDAPPGTFDLAVSYPAGSLADPPGREGLAELTRRLSQGPRAGGRGGPDRFDRLWAASALATSETRPEDVVYRARGPALALEAALQVEGERMAAPLQGAEAEDLDAVRDGLLRGVDLPMRGAELGQVQRAAALVFAGHPYGRLGAGTPATVAAVRLEEARTFAAEWMRAADAVVVLRTDEEPATAARRVAAALGTELAPGEPPPLAAPESPPVEAPHPGAAQRLEVVRAEVAGPQLWLAWRLEGVGSPVHADEMAAFTLAFFAIGERLREPAMARRVSRIDLGAVPGVAATLATVHVALASEEDALPVAEAVAQVVRTGGAARAEAMASAASVAAAQLLPQLPGPDAASLASLLRAGRDSRSALGFHLALVRATPDGILNAFQTSLAPERMTRMLFAPREGGAAPALPFPSPRGEPLPGPGFVPPGPEQVAVLLRAPGEIESRRTLPGGLQVRVVRRARLSRTLAALVLRPPAEGLAFPEQLIALTLNASRLPADHPACTGPRLAWDRGTAYAEFVGTWAREALPMLRCAMEQTDVDPARFADARARIAAMRSRVPPAPWPVEALARERCRMAYPSFAAGCSATSSAVEVSGLAAEGWAPWVARTFRPDRAVLAIAANPAGEGDLDALVDQHFGAWVPPAGAPVATREAPLPERPRATVLSVARAREAFLEVVVRARGGAQRDATAMGARRSPARRHRHGRAAALARGSTAPRPGRALARRR